MIHLWSRDNTAFVLARAILRCERSVAIRITIGGDRPEASFSASDLWETAVKSITQEHPRVGVAWNQASDEEYLFLQENSKNIISIPYEAISIFAERGISDTVEFRRLARKYLRKAKNDHCTAVFFLSGVLADETSRKIIAKTLGTQIKPYFVSDFLPTEFFTPTSKQTIEIFTYSGTDRVHREAEKLLHMKLAKGSVKEI